MSEPMIADLPYPSVAELSDDPVSARILSAAYATSCGELNCVLQYGYHSFHFAHAGDRKTEGLLKSVAAAEMIHLDLLGNALVNLGVSPVYSFQPTVNFNFYSTKFVAYSRSLRNMIEDDVMAEKHAVYGYEKMLNRLKNPKVKDLVARILEDEKLHLAAFMRALEEFC